MQHNIYCGMIDINYVILNANWSTIIFKYFKIMLGQISERQILGHLRFRVVRVQIGSGFGSSDLRPSQVWGRFGFESGRILDHLISGCLRYRIVRIQVRSGF
jgi:hypothetical protein